MSEISSQSEYISASPIPEDTVLSGRVVIGNNCNIGKNVTLENSILWDNIKITDNVTIKNCIIANDEVITNNIENRVIGHTKAVSI